MLVDGALREEDKARMERNGIDLRGSGSYVYYQHNISISFLNTKVIVNTGTAQHPCEPREATSGIG